MDQILSKSANIFPKNILNFSNILEKYSVVHRAGKIFPKTISTSSYESTARVSPLNNRQNCYKSSHNKGTMYVTITMMNMNTFKQLTKLLQSLHKGTMYQLPQ